MSDANDATLEERYAALKQSIVQLVETMTSQIDTFEKLAGKVSRIEARVAEIGMCEPQGKADVERIVGLECDLMRAQLHDMQVQVNALKPEKRGWFGRGRR